MILMLQISDEKLSQLKKALKISEEDYDALLKGRDASSPYALNIVEARAALDLSNHKFEVVANT
jgi:hypothetical protein